MDGAQVALAIGANLHDQVWDQAAAEGQTFAQFFSNALKTSWNLMGTVDARVPLSVSFDGFDFVGKQLTLKPVGTYRHTALFDASVDGEFSLDLDLSSIMDALLPAANGAVDGTESNILVCPA